MFAEPFARSIAGNLKTSRSNTRAGPKPWAFYDEREEGYWGTDRWRMVTSSGKGCRIFVVQSALCHFEQSFANSGSGKEAARGICDSRFARLRINCVFCPLYDL